MMLVSMPVCVAACDEEISNALRTKLHTAFIAKTDEVIFEHACYKIENSNNPNPIGDYDRIALAGKPGKGSLTQACTAKDMKFFQVNREQLAVSLATEAALVRCLGGIAFTARQTGQNPVDVRAAYVPAKEGAVATVASFSWAPQESLSCGGELERGSKIAAQGVGVTCKVLKNVDVVLTLTTDKGAKKIVLPRRPEVKMLNYTWRYLVNKNFDHITRCRNEFGLQGPWYKCNVDGTCNNREAINAMCAKRFGSSYITIDGVKVVE